MKKNIILFSAFAIVSFFQSCEKEKKEIEKVVTEEKVEEIVEVAPKLGNPAMVKADQGPFKIEILKYGYEELEPYIDTQTMELHYSKHYLGYTNNLNKAVEGTNLAKQSIEEILRGMNLNNAALRNNAGGFYNHRLYFNVMSPSSKGKLSGVMLTEIEKAFGSFDEFKKEFTEAAVKRFGSGWAWLIVDEKGNLVITSSANQDNPLMPNAEVRGTPILGIDVWEHAYYLKYQNRRPEYIESFYNVIDWDVVYGYYKQIKK